jgi:CRP-like cAMP-binding protein/Fe-S-cluster-containing hydrogenase component 2
MKSTEHLQQHQTTARVRAADAARQLEERALQQAEALAQLDCLKAVPLAHLSRVAEAGILRSFLPGATIVSERSPTQFLSFVLRGTIVLRLHDRVGREVLIGFLNRGDCFGEGPLFGDQFRSAACTAETTCYLLQVPLAAAQRLLDQSAELSAVLRTIYRERLVTSTLARIPLFSQLSPFSRSEIAQSLVQFHYPRGELIIREGATGEALYLIESGQVVVESDGRAIAHLDEGDFFGEMSLLTNGAHNADVRTLTPTDVLMLPAGAFRRFVGQQPFLAEQIKEIVERRSMSGASMRHDVERSEKLAAALDRGLLRGRHVLVRDPALCPDSCRICETACGARHGRIRLSSAGLQLDTIAVTDSCRQCRVGAECAEACPVDAIQWNDRGALIVTDACTGCGECVPACPYDAVQLAPRLRQQPSTFARLVERIQRLRVTIPLEPSAPTERADKCDLCHGYDDLACVQACPTGALRLAPIEVIFPL